MKYWDKAWSLISGCTPVSPACDNCWLRAMNDRFKKGDFTNIQICEDRLNIPLKTKKPTVFAVWSDLFHESVPADFITLAFEVMESCPQHTFLVCTKRPERIESVLYGQEGTFYLGGGDYIPNVYLGATVENQEMADKRIPELLKCRPFKLFLSVEPMLERIDLGRWLPYGKVQTVYQAIIAGCESGHHARTTDEDWLIDLREQCIEAGVPLWVKQLKINGKMCYDLKISTIQKGELW